MANTLKLGNGKWATGKDTVLAFNDENNNFKPLPFHSVEHQVVLL
jgi:hypothetical protein